MNAQTFLFYDIETTGLNYAFDQVLQFAAIRTDTTLKELERHKIKVQPRPDVICSPGALLTHGISIADARGGTCEFEATQEIHHLMNTPGTISLGYNTLGFDDEFLRFAFYRNLLPPYTHQYQNGCGRADLYPITAVYWLYKNQVLNWPEVDNTPTLQLAHLNEANQLAKGRAHDALVDVDATVQLARILARETETWNYLLACFDKKTDEERIASLPPFFQTGEGGHRLGVMVNGYFGPSDQYQAPVISLGTSIPYQNQTLWMRVDQPELQSLTRDAIPDTRVIRKRRGEPGLLLPPLARYWHRLGTERQDTVASNKKWLQANPELLRELIHHHRHYRYPFIPDLDVDAALYQLDFPTEHEKHLQRAFHDAPLSAKVNLIPQFPRPETRELAIRILARNYPQCLTDELAQTYRSYQGKINPSRAEDALSDYKGHKRTTPISALAEIEQMKAQLKPNPEQIALLDELASDIQRRFS